MEKPLPINANLTIYPQKISMNCSTTIDTLSFHHSCYHQTPLIGSPSLQSVSLGNSSATGHLQPVAPADSIIGSSGSTSSGSSSISSSISSSRSSSSGGGSSGSGSCNNSNSSDEFACVNFRLGSCGLKQIGNQTRPSPVRRQRKGKLIKLTGQECKFSPNKRPTSSVKGCHETLGRKSGEKTELENGLYQIGLSQSDFSPSLEMKKFKNIQLDSMRDRLFRLLSKVPIQVETLKQTEKPPELTHLGQNEEAKSNPSANAYRRQPSGSLARASPQPSTSGGSEPKFDYLREPLIIKYYQDRSLCEILELHFACSLLLKSGTDLYEDELQTLGRSGIFAPTSCNEKQAAAEVQSSTENQCNNDQAGSNHHGSQLMPIHNGLCFRDLTGPGPAPDVHTFAVAPFSEQQQHQFPSNDETHLNHHHQSQYRPAGWHGGHQSREFWLDCGNEVYANQSEQPQNQYSFSGRSWREATPSRASLFARLVILTRPFLEP